PFTVYRALRTINPSPYLFFRRLGMLRIVGYSPEVLVRVEGEEVALRPIAGTRPRGATEAQDRQIAEELLADPKERAEHVMLVDLGRNDVGRVSELGSVKVTEFMAIERYSHVMHLVSHVTGRLRHGTDALEVLQACFPAGTLTGAPKIRAMEIIDELEPTQRGPYGGAVAYVSYSGKHDSCITIRTIVCHGPRASVQVGAGHPGPGGRLPRGDPPPRADDARPRRLPRPPGDRTSLRRDRGAREDADAREGLDDPSRRAGRLRGPREPLRGDPLPLARRP